MNLNKIYVNEIVKSLKNFSKKDRYLLEAPSLKIPTINIGDRQKGRIRAKSIIDTDFKKEYGYSWRSDIKKSPKGVYEIVSIHWIDLINFHFGIKKINKPSLLNFSRIDNSFDASSVQIELKNRSIVNIFSTYNSAYSKRLFFLF